MGGFRFSSRSSALAIALSLCCVCVITPSADAGRAESATVRSMTPTASGWAWRNPGPQGNDLFAVGYGNGLYVGVGWHGTVVSSPDGKDWSFVRYGGEVEPFAVMRDVAYGNGTFVAVGGDDLGTNIGERAALVSKDGTAWKFVHVANDGHPFTSVAYANGIFVAVGGPRVYTSTDGLDWTAVPLPLAFGLVKVVYGNGTFLALGSNMVFLSSDGSNWTRYEPPVFKRKNITGLAYGNGAFVAVDVTWEDPRLPPVTTIARSENGRDWEAVARYTGERPYDGYIAFANGIFICGGGGPAVHSSADGIDWTDVTVSAGGYERSSGRWLGAANDTFFWLRQEKIFSSPDGISWAPCTRWNVDEYGDSAVRFYSGVFGGGNFVVVGDKGTVMVSEDGSGWTKRFSGPAPPARMPYNELEHVAYGRGTYVALGRGVYVVSSHDGGETWNAVAVPDTDNALAAAGWTPDYLAYMPGYFAGFRGLAYGKGLFVTFSSQLNATFHSDDGVHWERSDLDPGLPYGWDYYIADIAYGNGRFVAVGWDGYIFTSLDGRKWSRVYLDFPYYLMSVAYGNGRFVAVGDFDVLTSADGFHWAVSPGPTLENGLGAITFGGGKFVAAEWSGYFWESLAYTFESGDGVNWTRMTAIPTWKPIFGLAVGKNSVVAFGEGETILQTDRVDFRRSGGGGPSRRRP